MCVRTHGGDWSGKTLPLVLPPQPKLQLFPLEAAAGWDMFLMSRSPVTSHHNTHCITVRITMWELYFHARLIGGLGDWGSRPFSLCGSKMVTLSSCSAAKSLFRLWHTPSSALLRNVCYIFTITVCFLFCFFQIFCESFVEWVATFCIFRITEYHFWIACEFRITV